MASCGVVEQRDLSALPEELVLHICSKLDFKSLIRMRKTCRKLRDISYDESLWKQQCGREFLVKECTGKDTWYELFQWYHHRFGRLHSPKVYRKIRRLWDRLEKYLQENDAEVYDTLREPCDFSEILIAEQKMKCRFPPDLRCSLQIHNGQLMGDALGIYGCMSISSYFRSEAFLDAASMARVYDALGELPGCVPLTHCYISNVTQYIGVNDMAGFNVGEVFYPAGDAHCSESDVDIFITGNSYTEWFQEFIEMLEKNKFPRIDNRIYRFYEDPECMIRTYNCFTVTASTCFVPDLSSINPCHFLHIYRITLSMDKDADPRLSCQLETRQWVISDMDGNVETVQGRGVVGEHPVMTPGDTYSWVSCTTFSTSYGCMKGSFTMRNLDSGEEMEIICPAFTMKCLPYKESSQRIREVTLRKKNL